MCGKSHKHSFNTEVIVDFSISHAWMPHAIFLSDRSNPLWECWYNLSNLTNQRVYQELVYRNGSFKEMITGSAAPALPSFPPFYFRVCAFSIQRTQLSRSLEQATLWPKETCRGPAASLISSFKKVDMVLPIIRLKTSLTPIGRIPMFLSIGISVQEA